MGKPDVGPFLMGVGVLLLVLGSVGWFVAFGPEDPYTTDAGSNTFYIVLGVLLLWSGYMWSPNVRHDWCTIVGVGFLALCGIGFAVSGREPANLVVTHLETINNAFHLVLGLVMMLAGRRLLTEEVYVVPRRYRFLMATRAVKK